jgi:hypothetical protein
MAVIVVVAVIVASVVVFVVSVVVFVFAFTSVIVLRPVRGACFTPFFIGIQVLLNSIHDFLKSSYVETNMDFTVSRHSGVGLN